METAFSQAETVMEIYGYINGRLPMNRKNNIIFPPMYLVNGNCQIPIPFSNTVITVLCDKH